MPYITIHAQRKSRAIWRLVNSIDLHENLFLDSDSAENDDGENGAGGESGGAQSGGLDGKDYMRSAKEEDDVVDSDDEMDDEGEEFDVNLTGGDGGEGRSASLVCTYLRFRLKSIFSFEFYD